MPESPLERVTRLAGVSMVEPADVGVVDKDDSDDDVHEHLMRECPWYESVVNGHPQTTPPKHTGEVEPPDSGGALMKFTPRTPEASTVVQPTVPPGGPGLFHIKGEHLPPYVEHLYKHLVGRYGKHQAYGVAIGIVKKWAAGVNPGGWKTKSGKGKRTHPDVRAAAAKNVAQWEASRAKAHAQHGSHHSEHVKAAAAPERKLTRAEANYRDADVDGQTCHTCVNRTDGTCRLVQGTVSRTDVCDSYESMAMLAAPAGWPSGTPYAKSFLSPPSDEPRGMVLVSAPGAKPEYAYGQLQQAPSQTVSPSPPLPPSVDLPTPKELRGFAAELKGMQDSDENHHLLGAQMHLESAAEKITNNPVSALASLRSAQMAIQNEWRERISRNRPRIARVYSANTPPAEQSSQQQVWAKAQAQIGQMQGAASKVATFIDRVRRAYFGRMGMENQTAGGGIAGQPNARLSAVRSFERMERGREEHVRAHETASRTASADAEAKIAADRRDWELHGAEHMRNSHGVASNGQSSRALSDQHRALHQFGRMDHDHPGSFSWHDPDEEVQGMLNTMRPQDYAKMDTRGVMQFSETETSLGKVLRLAGD